MGVHDNIHYRYVDEITALNKKVEKLEKFVRKVARIPLVDIQVLCDPLGGDADNFRYYKDWRDKLLGIVKEAKVLTGKVKKKHTTLTSAGDKSTDSSP